MAGKEKKWYRISAPFGVDPFGQGELSSKVRTQPYGNVGGDSRFGLFEPSSGKSHANDYFSESDNTDNIEKRLEKQKEKRRGLKKKKRKEMKKKESWVYSLTKQSSLDPIGEGETPPLTKLSQWGLDGPTMPFWDKGDFKHKSYTEKSKAKQMVAPADAQQPKFPSNKVKRTGLEEDVEKNPFKKALRSSVTIKTIDGDRSEIGSGFFINSSMILTCFHVVSPSGNIDTPQIQITFDGQNFPAKIFAHDSELDAAVLIVNTNSNSYFPFLSQTIDQGDEIIVVGTPLGFENLVSDGIVSSGQNYSIENGGPEYFFISADIAPGNSGGPIIDKNKEGIAGMAAAIISREEDISGLSAAIPAENLKRFLNENGIEYSEI